MKDYKEAEPVNTTDALIRGAMTTPERTVEEIVGEFIPNPTFSSNTSFGTYLKITDRELTELLQAERRKRDEVQFANGYFKIGDKIYKQVEGDWEALTQPNNPKKEQSEYKCEDCTETSKCCYHD